MKQYPNTEVVNGRHICPICQQDFAFRSGFRRHYNNVHRDTGDAVGGTERGLGGEIDTKMTSIPLKSKTKAEKEKELLRNIKDIAQEVVQVLPKLQRLTPPIIKKGQLANETWVLLFSDLHLGQLVRAIEVGGLSEYSPAIAKERVEGLAQTIIRVREYHPNKPKELVIACLGDMVDGSIMRGNQQSNIEFGVVKQVIEGVELVSDFIVLLSGHFEKIRFYGVYGNHGRLTRSPTDAPPQENFDLMLYHFVQQRFKGVKGVSIEYTEAQHMTVRVENHNLWLEHGDTVRGWAGYPYYGADRERNNITAMLNLFNEKADYMLIAHHHRLSYFNNIIANGAFPGGDLYSVGRLRRMNMPEQTLCAFHKRHGLVWLRPIQLADPSEMTVKIYE